MQSTTAGVTCIDPPLMTYLREDTVLMIIVVIHNNNIVKRQKQRQLQRAFAILNVDQLSIICFVPNAFEACGNYVGIPLHNIQVQ